MYKNIGFMLFFALRDDNSYNDGKQQDTGKNVESEQSHIRDIGVFDNTTAIARKAAVNPSPVTKVAHGIAPAADGTKTPTTSEPKSIFAPSSRKLTMTRICSGASI